MSTSKEENPAHTFHYVSSRPSTLSPQEKLSFQGHFSMTNPKSPSKPIQVAEKHFEVRLLDKGKVAGSGLNRFGQFELEGTLDKHTGVLEVKRRYSPLATTKRKKKKKTSPVPREEEILDASFLPEAQALLVELRNKDKMRWFAKPVNAALLGLENYHTVVTRPMDFATIQTKLNAKQYAASPDVVEDLRLVFSNATLFNPKGTNVHRAAVELSFHLETRAKYLLCAGNGSSKRVRVAKKFFQHVNELDDSAMYEIATSAIPVVVPASSSSRKPTRRSVRRQSSQQHAAVADKGADGFESFDELDALDEFQSGGEGGGDELIASDFTEDASPPTGAQWSPAAESWAPEEELCNPETALATPVRRSSVGDWGVLPRSPQWACLTPDPE